MKIDGNTETPRNRLLYVLGDTGYVRYRDAKRLFNTNINMERVTKDLRDAGLIKTEGERKNRIIILTAKGREAVAKIFSEYEKAERRSKRKDEAYLMRKYVLAKGEIVMMQMGIPIRRSNFGDDLGTYYAPGKSHFKEMLQATGRDASEVDRVYRGGRRSGTLVTGFEFFNVFQLGEAKIRWEDTFEQRQVQMIQREYGRESGMLLLGETDALIRELIEYQRQLTTGKKTAYKGQGILKTYLPEYYSCIYFVNTGLRTYMSYPSEKEEVEESGYEYAKMEISLLLDKRVRDYVEEQCHESYDRMGYDTVSLLPMDLRKIYYMYINPNDRKFQMVCPIPYMDILREIFPDEKKYEIIGVNREIVYYVMSTYR